VIAVDTSSWIAYFDGASGGADVEAVDEALARNAVVLPPVVLTELLSDPGGATALHEALLKLPLLELRPGYWERAGTLRARLHARRVKARLADTLIAQSCIDDAVPLLTRETDFRRFARWAGLELIELRAHRA
jgi:predicted nucleic acid-binding protein